MSELQLKDQIKEVFNEVFELQNEGVELPNLESETVLLETGLDSLGFAIMVTRLEEEVGYDPFTLCADAYYPQTFGDFVEFYGKYKK